MYMAGALLEMMNLETIGEFIRERNIRYVTVVRNISVKVVSVTRPLVMCPGLIIHQRIHSVLKI